MTKRYICIHGHFYQPPRENPWLEAIEVQDSAHPYHDWNERIAVECYAANAAARQLDDRGLIANITNNYARMSFNFGPTLLSWMEHHRPDVYQAIIESDRQSLERFGEGSALAQVYNHIIMPLASRRDKISQVVWGIRDFEHRFGRKPKGMWLAETAVDHESLKIMAEHGIEFTILAPHQARCYRPLNHPAWIDANAHPIDTRRAYIQQLGDGLSMTIFFYDGSTSRAVAFERLLDRGEKFLGRLMDGFGAESSRPQLVHIATDGETYGHHHKYGEMALSYALDLIERNHDVELTIYPTFMARHPPQDEVDIATHTAWSCAHGVERWRSDCGCTNGETHGANQQWRAPLRGALNTLRDRAAEIFERVMAPLVDDPWAARNQYIDVILDRGHTDQFLAQVVRRPLGEQDRICVLSMLEMQRNAMLMFTSCGWFFDEISRIETVQLMRYAGRVIQLAQPHVDDDLQEMFLGTLALAKSHAPQYEHGAQVYMEHVRVLDLKRVCAHHAIETLFEETTHEYCYEINDLWRKVHQAGAMRMALGRVKIVSKLTGQHQHFDYAVVDMGDHNVTGGTRLVHPDDVMDEAIDRAVAAFGRGEYLSLIRLLDEYFEDDVFTLRSLFKDEQRRVVDHILSESLTRAQETYRSLYQQRVPLMRFLTDLGTPLPPAFQAAAQVALNEQLAQALSASPQDRRAIYALIKEAHKIGAQLDWSSLAYIARGQMIELTQAWLKAPWSLEMLKQVEASVSLAVELPFEVDLWDVQNAYFKIIERLERQNPHLEDEIQWQTHLHSLGQALFISPHVLS